jgi:outer membrane murein-binding lipoprotein Lpp
MKHSLTLLFAVVALSGIALSGCASKPAPVPVTSTVTTTIKASDAEQAQLDQQKAQQDQRQQQLDARESAVSQQEQMQKLSTITGNGTYLVNKEVMPGTYRNSGASGCYWERLSGLSGTNSDIIANDNASGPAIVTIESSDVAFATNRCGEWHKIG